MGQRTRRNANANFLAALLLSWLIASPVTAAIIISSPAVSTGFDFSLNGSPIISLAVGFTMGDTAQNLGSARARLSATGIATFPTDVVQAALYGDAGSNPVNPVLVTLTPEPGTITSATLDVVLTPTAPFTLEASTTYWLVLQADASVLGNLNWETSKAAAAGTLASYAGARALVGGVPPTDPTPANLIFAIYTPEPGSLSLSAVAFASLFLLRVSRRRGGAGGREF